MMFTSERKQAKSQKQFQFTKKINQLFILEQVLPALTHEVNNALSYIKLELEHLPLLQKKIDRLTELNRALQSFLSQKKEAYYFALHDCLDEALQITSPLFKNKILLQNKIINSSPQIYHHFLQLKQVFINILLLALSVKTTQKPVILKITSKKYPDFYQLLFCFQKAEFEESPASIELCRTLIEEYKGKLKISSSKNSLKISIRLHCA